MSAGWKVSSEKSQLKSVISQSWHTHIKWLTGIKVLSNFSLSIFLSQFSHSCVCNACVLCSLLSRVFFILLCHLRCVYVRWLGVTCCFSDSRLSNKKRFIYIWSNRAKNSTICHTETYRNNTNNNSKTPQKKRCHCHCHLLYNYNSSIWPRGICDLLFVRPSSDSFIFCVKCPYFESGRNLDISVFQMVCFEVLVCIEHILNTQIGYLISWATPNWYSCDVFHNSILVFVEVISKNFKTNVERRFAVIPPYIIMVDLCGHHFIGLSENCFIFQWCAVHAVKHKLSLVYFNEWIHTCTLDRKESFPVCQAQSKIRCKYMYLLVHKVIKSMHTAFMSSSRGCVHACMF